MPITEVIANRERMRRLATEDPFGPRYRPEDVERAAYLVIRSSSMTDLGVDWNEFTLYDADDKPIISRRLEGY